MKTAIITIILTAISLCTKASDTTVCIMSYNIRNGLGIDNKRDLKRISSTISAQHPDVICLQEVDSITSRSNYQYVLGTIASDLDMHPYFSPAIDFDGGKYGIGIISAIKPLSVHRIALPGREERRSLLIAEYTNYVIACTHLSLTTEDQLLSIPIIIENAKKWQKPFIICGDFNAMPDSTTIKQLKKHFKIISQTTSPTFPSDNPSRLIDYIMIFQNRQSEQVKTINAKVVNGATASDHLPQCVTIDISHSLSH